MVDMGVDPSIFENIDFDDLEEDDKRSNRVRRFQKRREEVIEDFDKRRRNGRN